MDGASFRRELDVYAEDLAAMTRENAALNEEILTLHRDKEVLMSSKDSLSVSNQREVQQLRVVELERDDMVQLYKECVEESQRQQSSLKTMQVEKEELIRKVTDYTVRNKALQEAEDKALQAAREESMNGTTIHSQGNDHSHHLLVPHA